MDLSSSRNVIVIILIVVAIVCGILGVRESYKDNTSLYTQSPAKVTNYSIESRQRNIDGSSTRFGNGAVIYNSTLVTEYSATITYEYEVNNLKYTGKFYGAMSNQPVFSMDRESVERLGKDYVGKTVPIFYETANVGNSTVHVDKNSSMMYYIISGILLIVALMAKFANFVPTPYVPYAPYGPAVGMQGTYMAPASYPPYSPGYVSITV
jgi:hypothetical protein